MEAISDASCLLQICYLDSGRALATRRRFDHAVIARSKNATPWNADTEHSVAKSETLRVSKYLSPAISETGVDTTAEAASKRRGMI